MDIVVQEGGSIIETIMTWHFRKYRRKTMDYSYWAKRTRLLGACINRGFFSPLKLSGCCLHKLLLALHTRCDMYVTIAIMLSCLSMLKAHHQQKKLYTVYTAIFVLQMTVANFNNIHLCENSNDFHKKSTIPRLSSPHFGHYIRSERYIGSHGNKIQPPAPTFWYLYLLLQGSY